MSRTWSQSTPWPTMEKKPMSTRARSTSAAAAARPPGSPARYADRSITGTDRWVTPTSSCPLAVGQATGRERGGPLAPARVPLGAECTFACDHRCGLRCEAMPEPKAPRRRYPHPRSILCYSRLVHELHTDGTVSGSMPVLPDHLDAG